MDVETIILCGGYGTRMKEETEYRPKPMVEVGGKPLLWHIMKIYRHFGHKNFVLALGYKGNYIKDFFARQELYTTNFTLDTSTGEKKFHDRLLEDDFKISFVDTGQDTLTGERVLRLKNYIKGDTFMVTYGDGLADIDIDALIAFHKKQGTIATITGVNPVSRFGLLNVNSSGVVTGFQQKPKLHDFVNGGFMVFDKKFFNYLKPGDTIEDAFLRLVDVGEISLYTHSKFWFCVDTMRDLEEANKLWNEESPWALWKNVTTDYASQKNLRNRGNGIRREPRGAGAARVA